MFKWYFSQHKVFSDKITTFFLRQYLLQWNFTTFESIYNSRLNILRSKTLKLTQDTLFLTRYKSFVCFVKIGQWFVYQLNIDYISSTFIHGCLIHTCTYQVSWEIGTLYAVYNIRPHSCCSKLQIWLQLSWQ